MAKSDDIEELPLPESRPKLARRAFVLVDSMLKDVWNVGLDSVSEGH
jgi:hypothetical protein